MTVLTVALQGHTPLKEREDQCGTKPSLGLTALEEQKDREKTEHFL